MRRTERLVPANTAAIPFQGRRANAKVMTYQPPHRAARPPPFFPIPRRSQSVIRITNRMSRNTYRV